MSGISCRPISSPCRKENISHKLKVCLVSGDSLDDQRTKALLDLSKTLVQTGHEITFLSLSAQMSASFNQQLCRQEHNVCFVSLQYSGPVVSSLLPSVHSYHVMQWMLENGSEFDLVHFPLSNGIGYYTLLAKHQGWAFQKTQFCVDCYSSTLWHKYQNKKWIDHIDDLAADFLEKETLRLADGMIYQENELLDWMPINEWQFPSRVFSFSQGGEGSDYLHVYETLCLCHYIDSSALEQGEVPLISVCLTHFNRPHYLTQALASLRAQDYSNFEIILIDDASTQPEALAYLDSLQEEFQSKGWTIIRNKTNLFPGAARNLAARHSQGDYLLFMDDDNYAKSHEMRMFIQVAKHVNADILTCAMDVFTGVNAPQHAFPIHRFLPMGAALSVGLYLNMFGDMNALIKKTVYEALNGLTEERGVGGEDWELFSRAVWQGYHLETIPMPLFWYRDTPSSITKTTHLYANSLRGIRSYLSFVPPALRSNLMLSQAQQDALQKLLIERNYLGKLLKRCWHLFFSRARRAILHPRRSIKKLLKH